MTSGNTLNTTVDQWRAEMERIDAGSPGFTAAELADQLGIPKSTILGRIAKMAREGRCVAGIGLRKDSAGRNYHVQVFEIKREKES